MAFRIPLAVLATASISSGTPSAACDVALAFAVDVSASVSPDTYRTQISGLAEALRDPVISGELARGRAALSLTQWTGAAFQDWTIPWVRIEDANDVAAFAARVEAVPRAWRGANTAIGALLTFAPGIFAQAPPCHRQVLDVSGNGPSNEGEPPDLGRMALIGSGVTINGIVVAMAGDDLTLYFAENVIGGPGAFVVNVDRIADYPEKMKQKLIRELAIQMVSAEP